MSFILNISVGNPRDHLVRNTDCCVYFPSIHGMTFLNILPLYLTDFIQIKCKEDAKMSSIIGAIGNIGSDLILEMIRRT